MNVFRMPVDKAAVVSGAGVILAAAVTFGLPLNGEQTSAILAVVGLAALVWNWFVAQKTTTEFTRDGGVYRGPANEGATGEYVRERGSLNATDGGDDLADGVFGPAMREALSTPGLTSTADTGSVSNEVADDELVTGSTSM